MLLYVYVSMDPRGLIQINDDDDDDYQQNPANNDVNQAQSSSDQPHQHCHDDN